MREKIDGAAFAGMLLCAYGALEAEKQKINELNVFPVPDGDTGTNMCLTLSAAAEQLSAKRPASVGAAADCAASALLRGARGNSGVILSLLFRGISKVLKGRDEADCELFAAAMTEGVDAAYKAVMKPAEGTILTVSRLSAAAAVEYAKAGDDLEMLLELALEAGHAALDNTINQNPVLKRAGVVDAGGRGYIVIFEAMLAYLQGRAEAVAPSEAAKKTAEGADFAAFDSAEITFAYDTVFIVKRTPGKPLDLLRAYLDSIGDSLVIGEDDELFKVHVHTNIPGSAITEAQKYGVLETAKVENMRTQHDELAEGAAEVTPEYAEAEKRYGAVAICAGAGMSELFRELGADQVVSGGQTMNPSTEDILQAVNRVPAECVFVFPNNKNIILAAQQCDPLTEKQVVVVPTKTVPAGISAILSMDEEQDVPELSETLESAASAVHTALVTYAARDSDFDGHSIRAGEYLALLDGALLGNYPTLPTLLKELSWAFGELEPAIITIYYGEDVTEEQAASVSASLSDYFPDSDVSLVYGGQPVYYYMISAE